MSKNAGNTSTMAETNYPSFQLPAVQQMISEAQRLYASPGPSLFPGSRVAPFNPLEQQGQEALVGAANTSLPAIANGAGQYAGFNLGKGRDPNANPYFQSTLNSAVRPIREQLLEQVLPSIRNQSLVAGTYGGSRQGIAEGLATKGAINAAQDTTANLSSQEYNNAQNRAMSTLNFLPTLQSLITAPGQVLSGVGETQRGLAQAQLDEQAQKYEYEQQLPYQKLAEFANYIRSPYGSTATSTVHGPEASTGSQIAGAALSLPALISLVQGLFH